MTSPITTMQKAAHQARLLGGDLVIILIMGLVAFALFGMSNFVASQKIGDAALAPLLSITATMLGIGIASHLMTRIFLPSVDIKALVIKAQESSVGSAIVFAGVCALLCTVILATVSMFH